MSSTPEVTSVDGKVSVASHLLNLPSMATEAFTKNLTSLSSGVMVKTGPGASAAWGAWANDGSSADAKRQKTVNRMESLLLKVSDTTTIIAPRLSLSGNNDNHASVDHLRLLFTGVAFSS